jgi:hypothetical protein
MAKSKDRDNAQSDALFAAVKWQPGTFNEIFARAWPVFRRSHVGGEDLARLQSYELLYRLSMRGKINKVNKIYEEAGPRIKS